MPPADGPEGPQGRPTPGERSWAAARAALGQAQMIAAVVGLYLFVTMGTACPAIVAAAVAGLLVAASRLLFGQPAT